MGMHRKKSNQYLLFEQFQTEMNKLNGYARLIPKISLHNEIIQILSKGNNAKVTGYSSPFIEKLAIPSILKKENLKANWIPENVSPKFDYSQHFKTLANTDYAITSCDFLISDTATVAFSGKQHPSRLLTLLPAAIIVISQLNSLVENLNSAYKQLKRNQNHQHSSFLLFTGPSRTADIEKKLVLGVHGPKELYVFVIDEKL